MLTIDARCTVGKCTESDIYRMVGGCTNCGTKDVLILLTANHPAQGSFDCPRCGCNDVRAHRIATDDEIPVA